MIIPWLRGFLSFSQAPLTWTLIAANAFVFLSAVDRPGKSSSYWNSDFIIMSGHLYHEYKSEDLELEKTDQQWVLLGTQALRDPEFIRQAPQYQFHGDEIAIRGWKEKIENYQSEMEMRPSHWYGLNFDNMKSLSWITYQFMHAGLFHLLGNMAMLLIFGAAVESFIGGLGLVTLYLLGGAAGGLGFMLLGAYTTAPVIGASGSVTTIMAFYMLAEKKRRVPFFYFFSPIEGYYGFIHLPVLAMLPLVFLPDLVGFFATPEELGAGVAYSAHIGGALLGFFFGFLYRYLFSLELKKSLRASSDPAPQSEI